MIGDKVIENVSKVAIPESEIASLKQRGIWRYVVIGVVGVLALLALIVLGMIVKSLIFIAIIVVVLGIIGIGVVIVYKLTNKKSPINMNKI